VNGEIRKSLTTAAQRKRKNTEKKGGAREGAQKGLSFFFLSSPWLRGASSFFRGARV
jgi:hypothetical protein